ncbi:hypothetical protein [Vulgatibacter incomptus]|uniref:Tetratricopeptide repeat domain protein n=1 Tax=Vulgatibacter incomptus TaxID=1391653 RepID=A0A0K1PA72_9BACT|nr:hypothetical protein [Vulgatibacter incomptus]AKU90402.1 Tetratricopeptide repeat domain protein [Vulgatibacter incomptus]
MKAWGRWFRRLLPALLLALAPVAALAAADDDLRRARDLFEYGDYAQARDLAASLLDRNVLASDEQLVDANRIVALAWFYDQAPDRKEKAERFFLQLLSIEPEYRLDPFFTTPAAVAFFDLVRTEHEEDLAPIREQRRRAKEARRAEEEARRRFLDAQARAGSESGASGLTPAPRNLALVFLPFGAGQFQNGDTTAGYILGSIQLAAGATSAATFLALNNVASGGKVARRDLPLARTLDTVKWTSAAIFYLSWAAGIADAWSRFEPERRGSAPGSPGSPDLRAGARAPMAVPILEAGPDGASLGLALQF